MNDIARYYNKDTGVMTWEYECPEGYTIKKPTWKYCQWDETKNNWVKIDIPGNREIKDKPGN